MTRELGRSYRKPAVDGFARRARVFAFFFAVDPRTMGPRGAKPALGSFAVLFAQSFAVHNATINDPKTSDSQMTVLRPRSRTISIRLSEEEFSALRQICLTSGARSVSDLARDAMHDLLKSGSKENTMALTRDDHSVHMKELELKVEKLFAEIAMFKSEGK